MRSVILFTRFLFAVRNTSTTVILFFFSPTKVMIVVGGQAPKAIRSVECYDFEEERWDQVAELPSRRCRAGKFCFHNSLTQFHILLGCILYLL